ncbi:VOC family protein [Microbacterium sp. NPDC090007]|uniref:VOC family protein n=1 Tax=Microbacterium sp. NPDC090007 TaxID=3364204 RepID=UPI0037FCE073
MELKAATVGIPVRDLDAATSWYRSALSLGDVDLAPLEGLVEFNLGPIWLQLAADSEHAGGEGISLNFSVPDASAEHARFKDLGLDVSAMQFFEGVVEFFTLTDPDGNKLGFVTELA